MPNLNIEFSKHDIYETLSGMLYTEERCQQILLKLQQLRRKTENPFLHEKVERQINKLLDFLAVDEFIMDYVI